MTNTTALYRRQNIPTLFNTKLFGDLFEDFFTPTKMRIHDSAKIDIKEFDDRLEVVADVPGFKREDISIKYEKNYLTVSGELVREKDENDVKYLHKEIENRSFHRTFYLGDSIDSTNIDAKFKDGVLIVVLPKSEKEKMKEIVIN